MVKDGLIRTLLRTAAAINTDTNKQKTIAIPSQIAQSYGIANADDHANWMKGKEFIR